MAMSNCLTQFAVSQNNQPSGEAGLIINGCLNVTLIFNTQTHAAGVFYLDFTLVMILFGVAIMSTRYLTMGIGDTALYILAGIGAVLFLAIRFLFMRGRSLDWLLKQLEQNRTCYLSGGLRMGDQKATPL